MEEVTAAHYLAFKEKLVDMPPGQLVGACLGLVRGGELLRACARPLFSVLAKVAPGLRLRSSSGADGAERALACCCVAAPAHPGCWPIPAADRNGYSPFVLEIDMKVWPSVVCPPPCPPTVCVCPIAAAAVEPGCCACCAAIQCQRAQDHPAGQGGALLSYSVGACCLCGGRWGQVLGWCWGWCLYGGQAWMLSPGASLHTWCCMQSHIGNGVSFLNKTLSAKLFTPNANAEGR